MNEEARQGQMLAFDNCERRVQKTEGFMKKFLIILFLFICTGAVFAEETQDAAIQDAELPTTSIEVYSEKDKFGLIDKSGEAGVVLVKPVFKKLIKIGNSAWICQKGSKFGLIDKYGNYLVQPKYQVADRIFGKYAKFGNGKDYGLYNEKGYAVIKPEYMSIEPLQGRMFLTCKNYKYGVINIEGKELLAHKFDNIYMPERGKLRIKYEGQWYELSELTTEHIELPDDVMKLTYGNKEITITKIVTNPVAASGYSAVTATNYFLKVFSAISPSYEKTIDDLVYSKGADAVNTLMNFSWIPKFPYTYAKNYYNNFKAPNNGPLSDIRDVLKNNVNNVNNL